MGGCGSGEPRFDCGSRGCPGGNGLNERRVPADPAEPSSEASLSSTSGSSTAEILAGIPTSRDPRSVDGPKTEIENKTLGNMGKMKNR